MKLVKYTGLEGQAAILTSSKRCKSCDRCRGWNGSQPPPMDDSLRREPSSPWHRALTWGHRLPVVQPKQKPAQTGAQERQLQGSGSRGTERAQKSRESILLGWGRARGPRITSLPICSLALSPKAHFLGQVSYFLQVFVFLT